MRWCPSRVVIAVVVLRASSAVAQCRDSVTSIGARQLAPLPLIGGIADDRARVLQDIGRCPTAGQLVRSTSALAAPLAGDTRVRWAPIAPVFESAWNGGLPWSMNDGAAWAGRGLTTTATAGVRVESGRFALTFAPQLIYEQNREFFVPPGIVPGHSTFSTPWHTAVESIDLPLRFGDQPTRLVTFGESRLEAGFGAIGVGASSEELWWGPGIRNAILLSDNAAGIPQVYVRTLHPIITPIGRVEGRFFAGDLTESLYFDAEPRNDNRSLNAAVATLNLAADTGLTLGLARAVYAPVSTPASVFGHLIDVFARWDQSTSHSSDQIYSLFGRWIFPESGMEIYGEWAKLSPPAFHELLIQPQTGQGFTVGLQWVRPLGGRALLRTQFEATMLEQTPATAGAEVRSFYTSPNVPQGYTQRGQSIGAAIGPGSSSQWLAGDYFVGRRRIGIFAGRVRWEDDAYYRQPSGIEFVAHDVSLFAGIRGSLTLYGTDVVLEAQHTLRLNYLFQTATNGYQPDPTFDIRGNSLRLSLTPAANLFRR